MWNCPLFVLFSPILDFAFFAGLFSLFRRAVFAFSPGCFFAGLIFTHRPSSAGLFSLPVTPRIEGLRCLLRRRRGREGGIPRRGTAAMEALINSFPLKRQGETGNPRRGTCAKEALVDTFYFSGLDFSAYFDLPRLLAALAFCVSYLYLCSPRRPLELLPLLLLTVLTRPGLHFSWLCHIFDFLFFFNSVQLIFVRSVALSSSIVFVPIHQLSRVYFGWCAFR